MSTHTKLHVQLERSTRSADSIRMEKQQSCTHSPSHIWSSGVVFMVFYEYVMSSKRQKTSLRSFSVVFI